MNSKYKEYFVGRIVSNINPIIALTLAFVSLLASSDFRGWIVERLGGVTSEEYSALKEQSETYKGSEGLFTAWGQLSFEYVNHLICTSLISDILHDSYNFEINRFSATDVGTNFSGAYFSGFNGAEFIHGSYACTEYNIIEDLSYSQVVIVTSSRSEELSKALLQDIKEESDLKIGKKIWPPRLIREYIDSVRN